MFRSSHKPLSSRLRPISNINQHYHYDNHFLSLYNKPLSTPIFQKSILNNSKSFSTNKSLSNENSSKTQDRENIELLEVDKHYYFAKLITSPKITQNSSVVYSGKANIHVNPNTTSKFVYQRVFSRKKKVIFNGVNYTNLVPIYDSVKKKIRNFLKRELEERINKSLETHKESELIYDTFLLQRKHRRILSTALNRMLILIRFDEIEKIKENIKRIATRKQKKKTLVSSNKRTKSKRQETLEGQLSNVISIGVQRAPKIPLFTSLFQSTQNIITQHPEISDSTAGIVVGAHTLLSGIKTADQWLQNGIYVDAIDQLIRPSFGVYIPTRQEHFKMLRDVLYEQYSKLDSNNNNNNKARNTLPLDGLRGLDIGTGSGVLAIMLGKLGCQSVTGTDSNPWAVECAVRNCSKASVKRDVNFNFDIVSGQDVYPPKRPGQYDVIVCNPPWIEGAHGDGVFDDSVFDPSHGFLNTLLLRENVEQYLSSKGKIFVLYSDLSQRIKGRPNDPSPVEEIAAANNLKCKKVAEINASNNEKTDDSDRDHILIRTLLL